MQNEIKPEPIENDTIVTPQNDTETVPETQDVEADQPQQPTSAEEPLPTNDSVEKGLEAVSDPQDTTVAQAKSEPEKIPTIDVSPCIRHTYEELVWFGIMVASFFAVKPFFYTLILPMLSDESQIRTLITIVNGSIYLIAAVALYNLARATHKMLYHNLKITPHHIDFREGILNTKSTKINMVKIRAVDVEQTLAQKALNIGTVSFASASTDGYEIVVRGVYKPYQLRAYIKHRIGVLAYDEPPGTVNYP